MGGQSALNRRADVFSTVPPNPNRLSGRSATRYGLHDRHDGELDGTFKSGFRNATRWKDGRLFGELVEQNVEFVKGLLAKAREAHHNDHPLDGATARPALEGAGWVKKEPSR